MRVSELPSIRTSRCPTNALAPMGVKGFPDPPSFSGILSKKKLLPLRSVWGLNKTFSRLLFGHKTAIKNMTAKRWFAPIDSNAEAGPAFPFAIFRINGNAMREWAQISRPA